MLQAPQPGEGRRSRDGAVRGLALKESVRRPRATLGGGGFKALILG